MKGTLTQDPAPVPELGSVVGTAGGRVVPGAQAHPSCKITLLCVFVSSQLVLSPSVQRGAQGARTRELIRIISPKGPISDSGIEL